MHVINFIYCRQITAFETVFDNPSMWLEVVLAVLVSVLYVVSIQISVPTDIRPLSRDDERVIGFRMRRVVLLCGAWIVALATLWKGSNSVLVSMHAIINDIGISVLWHGLFYTLFRMAIMYSLPMAQSVWDLAKSPRLLSRVTRPFSSLHAFRDYIFAPILEELVYRGLVWVCVERAAKTSIDPAAFLHAALWWTPFLFGLPHIHHHVEHFKDNFFHALVALLVQTAYTAAFGALANQEYLRNKSIWDSVAAHTVCNIMGIPDLAQNGNSRWRGVYLSVTFGCLGIALFAM